jgi:hypothetical protein
MLENDEPAVAALPDNLVPEAGETLGSDDVDAAAEFLAEGPFRMDRLLSAKFCHLIGTASGRGEEQTSKTVSVCAEGQDETSGRMKFPIIAWLTRGCASMNESKRNSEYAARRKSAADGFANSRARNLC